MLRSSRTCPRLLLLAALLLSASGVQANDPPPAPGKTATATAAAGAPAALPHNLTPMGMFRQADWVVKAVMLTLLAASLVTWIALLAKGSELRALSRRQRQTLLRLSRARSLDAVDHDDAFLAAARAEWRLSAAVLSDGGGLKERVATSLQRLEAASGRRASRGTGVLATIGATAPFVGLFGTVWGIMNSFIGISKAQTTSLAVVAPGIAEALLATALGLVAAIPAVVIYNHFARRIQAYRAQVADTTAAVLQLVSRDLSHCALKPATRPTIETGA
ncbi:tonB-system energizer ExbB [Microbulbifer litoralis]|uniref:tonB-system energizer ExbB n=1 Tax=Microbulbifer litoralis TaxID=2933965 RepID=UPI002027D5E6|nr:tonB-system energizer ExbB [Microbulbifer sp. GX H0434]